VDIKLAFATYYIIFYRSGREMDITEINEKKKKPEKSLFFGRVWWLYINTRRSLYYDIYIILTCAVDAMKSLHNIFLNIYSIYHVIYYYSKRLKNIIIFN